MNNIPTMSAAHGQEAQGGAAQPAEDSTEGHRIASNGEAYTWLEFQAYYGKGAMHYWRIAYNQTLPWQIVDENGKDGKLHWDDAPANNIRQQQQPPPPVPMMPDRAPPPPPPQPPQQQQQQKQQPPPPPPQRQHHQDRPFAWACIYTFKDMLQEEPVQGMGSAAAAKKQNELRKECMDKKLTTIEITDTWTEWRKCLRALPTGLQQQIVGKGIIWIKFQLQGKHVFEVVRVDKSCVQLHFHSNGTMDDPVLIPSTATPDNANGGASQPTVIDMSPTSSQAIIGRKECMLALDTILSE